MVLNSKSDFQQAPLVRLVATTGLLEEQSSSQETGAGSGRSWARQEEEVGLPWEGGE